MVKKIFIILITFFPLNVLASKYYTEYSPYLLNQDDFMEETDTLKREEVKLYNTYEIKKNYYGYYPSDKCEFYNESDYIEGTFKEKEGSSSMKDELTQTNLIQYSDIEGFKVISFKENVRIYDMYILDKENPISIKVVKKSKDISNILDDNSNTYIDFTTSDNFELSFINKYEIKDIKIIFKSSKPIIADIATKQDNNTTTLLSYMNANVLNWTDRSNFEKLIADFGYKVNNANYNQYHVLTGKKYNCYTKEKIIKNNYKREDKNIILDDFIIKYDYYKRDFIELDDIEINEKTNLSSLILDSSLNIGDFDIKSDIDYSKDGLYNISFVLDNFIIDKSYSFRREEPLIENSDTSLPENKDEEKDIIEEPIKEVETIIKEPEIIDDIVTSVESEKPIKEEIKDHSLKIKKTKKKRQKKVKVKNIDSKNTNDLVINKNLSNEIVKVEPLKASTSNKQENNTIYLKICILLLILMLYLLYRHIKEYKG